MEKSVAIQMLDDIYQLRRKQNSAYSIRAFARDLGISPAYISLLLSGKRQLTPRKALEIGRRLGFRGLSARKFVKSTLPPNLRSAGSALVGDTKIDDYETLGLDQFRFLTEIHHVAILDLATCSDFNSDPLWIADRLNLRIEQVGEALSRLQRLGLLCFKDGKPSKTKRRIMVTDEKSQEAIRDFHRKLMYRAIDELQNSNFSDFSRRSISGMTMAINPKRLGQAFARIDRFQKQLAQFLSEGDCTEVYHMGIQFIPLTSRRS